MLRFHRVTIRTHPREPERGAAVTLAAVRDIPNPGPLRQVLAPSVYGRIDVPVSRGRRVKKTSNSSGGRARATVLDRPRSALSTVMSQLGSPSERGQWFDPAIAAVLDQAHVVPEALHPRALERLTSQLIGDQLHQVLVAEKTGLWFDR